MLNLSLHTPGWTTFFPALGSRWITLEVDQIHTTPLGLGRSSRKNTSGWDTSLRLQNMNLGGFSTQTKWYPKHVAYKYIALLDMAQGHTRWDGIVV